MLQVALTFENTPEDIQAAASIIEVLRTLQSADEAETVPVAIAPPLPPNADPNDWKVPAWFNRLGDGSRKFWMVAAQYALTHTTFTFDELAAESGLAKGALRSYQRNSYRAIHAENAHDPLKDSDWDANRQCNVYRLNDIVRDELLRLTQANTI